MRRLFRLVLFVSVTGLLAACQTGGPGKGPAGAAGGVTPNAVTGDPIEVTPLDAPPEAGAEAPDETEAAGAERAAPQVTPPGPEAEAEPEAEVAPPDPAPKADLEEVPETPKSERQLACEKKKGVWSKIGKGDLRACVFMTKDSGKSCDKESDCEGVCLARSRTCSPAKPLFGCNEILQDNGARVTLCIE